MKHYIACLENVKGLTGRQESQASIRTELIVIPL